MCLKSTIALAQSVETGSLNKGLRGLAAVFVGMNQPTTSPGKNRICSLGVGASLKVKNAVSLFPGIVVTPFLRGSPEKIIGFDPTNE